MEPVTQTILGKSVYSAINFGAQSLARKISNSIFAKDEISRAIFENSTFIPLIEGDLESINIEISNLKEASGINFNFICKFFEYPEIECVIRQIYAANIPSDFTFEESIKEIEDEFILLSSQYFDVDKEKIKGLASLLFNILIEGCQVTLNEQVSKGELSALLAISNYQTKIILDELDGIRKNNELLSKEKLNFKEIQLFFESYRNQLAERHEWIPIANLEGNTRKPIEKIYVCPNFVKRKQENNNPIEFYDFLSRIHRIVILGDPGAGKTTFTRKICYELSIRYSDRLFEGREIVPFVVVVRDYQAEKKKNNISIVDFIKEELRSDFQIEPPKGSLEYLLLNGYIFLIFDGLDELLDVRYREKMVYEIESFSNLYSSIPIIVTSRKIGYEEASLREDMFEIYEITSLNENQIKEYVEKWFSLDPDYKQRERSEKARRFLIESEKVSDIRSNSLMLSLMCNIYKHENYIPENRPRIYQKCAEMLFKTWDRHRGINPDITIQDTKIESLISYLANWIYTDESLKDGVREEELIKKATEYLHPSTIEDIDEAKEIARDFIKFSKGRAWILSAVGSTKEHELYKFTHRTFLEYFTAEWLCRKFEETNELTKSLIPRIKKREWDVVAQLAFQMRGEFSESASEKIFNTILKVAKESTDVERKNLLSFAARSLSFMTPNPNTVKAITKDCFEFSLHLGKKVIDEESEDPGRVILELKDSVKENRNKVSETLKNLIVECIKIKKEPEAMLAAEILFLIKDDIFVDLREKEQRYWSEEFYDTLNECYQHNKSVFEENIHLCIHSYRSLFKNDIEIILNIYGLRGIFSDYLFSMTPNCYFEGIGESLLNSFIYRFSNYYNDDRVNLPENLRKFGSFCLKYPFPINLNNCDSSLTRIYKEVLIQLFNFICSNYSQFEEPIDDSDLFDDPTISYGMFCLFGIECELLKDSKYISQLSKLAEELKTLQQTRHISWFIDIVCVRLGIIEYDRYEREFTLSRFNSKQGEFIKKWAKNEVHFLINHSKQDKNFSNKF